LGGHSSKQGGQEEGHITIVVGDAASLLDFTEAYLSMVEGCGEGGDTAVQEIGTQ
jgi:hypothetical protein